MRHLVIFFILFFSSSVFADTYPTTIKYYYGALSVQTMSSSGAAACTAAAVIYDSSYHGDFNGSYGPIDACKIYTPVNNFVTQSNIGIDYSCPYGGSYSSADSYATCQGAPSCSVGQVRNTLSGACQTPLTCTAPAVYDNPSNSCITPACPSGQSRLPAPDYTCVANPTCPSILPLCASTAYDCNNGDGTQQHVIQCATVCPAGQHMIGKDCVNDKTTVISCPSGFFAKDGGCVAADPVACPAGTRTGKINGETVCVGAGSKTPSTSNEPQETHNTGTGTNEGTTTTVQKDAAGNVTGTSTSTTTGTNKIDLNTTGLATESTNKGILNALTEAGTTSTTVTPADTSKLDTAGDTALSQINIANPASYFITSFVVLPSSSCQTVPFHYKALNYDLDPCTKLQAFRDLLGYFLYIITAIFIYQTATRPAGD